MKVTEAIREHITREIGKKYTAKAKQYREEYDQSRAEILAKAMAIIDTCKNSLKELFEENNMKDAATFACIKEMNFVTVGHDEDYALWETRRSQLLTARSDATNKILAAVELADSMSMSDLQAMLDSVEL